MKNAHIRRVFKFGHLIQNKSNKLNRYAPIYFLGTNSVVNQQTDSHLIGLWENSYISNRNLTICTPQVTGMYERTGDCKKLSFQIQARVYRL